MTYEITKHYVRSDWLTENTTTTNDVFQFAKIEYHSETFQRYFSYKNEFHTFHSERYRLATSDPVKALQTLAYHWQNNPRLHIVQEITKTLATLHNLPKSMHNIQFKPYLENKKSNLCLMNLPFTSAVKNCTQWNKSWEERLACHAVPVAFHSKKGE